MRNGNTLKFSPLQKLNLNQPSILQPRGSGRGGGPTIFVTDGAPAKVSVSARPNNPRGEEKPVKAHRFSPPFRGTFCAFLIFRDFNMLKTHRVLNPCAFCAFWVLLVFSATCKNAQTFLCVLVRFDVLSFQFVFSTIKMPLDRLPVPAIERTEIRFSSIAKSRAFSISVRLHPMRLRMSSPCFM